MALGLAASQMLSSVVYQATPADPIVLAGVIAAMCVIAVVATWMPAGRALRIDPVRALRED
jgi:ABC-type lipoprotein release transport system permease subunit